MVFLETIKNNGFAGGRHKSDFIDHFFMEMFAGFGVYGCGQYKLIDVDGTFDGNYSLFWGGWLFCSCQQGAHLSSWF